MEKAMEATKLAMENMKSIDMEKMQRNLERTEENLKMNEGRMKEEMLRAQKSIQQNMHKDFKKEFEKANEGMKRAAAELQNYKDDGHRNGQRRPYQNARFIQCKIQKRRAITIDGKVQPDNITNKYKHYFRKDNVTIKKIKDGEDNDDRTIDL